jgi:sulfur relay (sulfurtransferase) complex TusBCD TusD component (DsrE family)
MPCHAALRVRKTPDGYYNIERMLKRYATGAHRILLCGTCMDTRGIGETDLLQGARRSSMDELAGQHSPLTKFVGRGTSHGNRKITV